MELINTSDRSAEKWMAQIGRGAFYLALCFTFLLWFHLIFNQPSIEKIEHPLPTVDLQVLGQHSLALSRPLPKELQPLLHDLILIGVNTRPDQETLCALAIRSSAEEKTAALGEPLYFKTRDGCFLISDTPTELTFTPRSLENILLLSEVNHHGTHETFALSASAIFSQTLAQEPY